ncbi:chemotaxis protein CheA [Sphingomonas sp. KRR8]|uniref:chemotaxis protein CheA n=1 Tax=Sphingomonas sp. KRR8 TaxID=2942996 RepID=UPI002020711B|nr:chemotaxis protein CheA [Sphingomonas sp. KRR8]URD61924.1 chemotaxis protein CheA [Sphingomonas sp. KRR8]
MSELDDIQAIFFEECAEGLTAAEAGLSAMVEGDTSDATIAAVFRAVHSIKGGSGAFGHSALMAFSHRFENVLDEVRSGRMAPTRSLVQQLLRAFDVLSDHVLAARGEAAPPADGPMRDELDRLLAGGGAGEIDPAPNDPVPTDDDPFGFEPVLVSLDDFGPPEESDDGGWSVHFRPSRAAMANGAEPLLVVRELERLGGRVDRVLDDRLPSIELLDPADSYLGWQMILPGTLGEDEIRECFDFIPPDSVIEIERIRRPSTPEPSPATDAVEVPLVPTPAPVGPAASPNASEKVAPKAEAMSVRVDLARLDHLLNLVGELVIRNSVLADRLAQADQEKVELPQLLRLTRQIQDGVMGLRAQPIAQAFNRVPRMLRDLEAETGKSIRLEISGEQTEVDKRVIERIGDPLTHMIRNAADHGIESSERRLAAGKDAQGTIFLLAEQKGGRIIVRVTDDGGGIDRVRVLAKAIDKGIVSATAELTDEDIDQLICAPGFSTAETISNISGRGVGMDVVRSNIEQLGGRVEISSVPGQGTSFTMILPLTLAILDGMVVRLSGHRYVLPLGSVIESVQPEPGQLQALSPGSEVLELRGSFLPVRRLNRFFNLRGEERAPEDSLVIVVETDSVGAIGLMVDTIEDRREVVIKSLDQNLYPVRGLGGATVLGDGSIALILDIDAIVTASGPASRLQKGMAA